MGPALAAICITELLTLGALVIPIAAGVAGHLAAFRPDTASWTLEQGQSHVFLVAALVSLVAQIVFGWWSDRVRTSPTGRLPFVVLGTVVGAVGVWQAGQGATLGAVTMWFSVATFGYAATFSGLFGTFADLVEGSARSRWTGWLSGVGNGSTAIPLAAYTLLPVSAFTTFGLFPLCAVGCAIVGALVVHPQLRTVRDRPPARDAAPSDVPRWRSQFWLLVAQRGLGQLAFVFAAIYAFLFLVRRVGLDPQAASTTQWVTGISATADVVCLVASVAAGYLVARTLNALPLMRIGLVVLAVGLVAIALATTTWAYLAAKLVVGVGAGVYLACDLGLVFRVVPPRTAGWYLGFFNIARNLPQSIAPIIGPMLLGIGSADRIGVDRSQNYTAFFVVGALIALLALIPLAALRVTSADSPGGPSDPTDTDDPDDTAVSVPA